MPSGLGRAVSPGTARRDHQVGLGAASAAAALPQLRPGAAPRSVARDCRARTRQGDEALQLVRRGSRRVLAADGRPRQAADAARRAEVLREGVRRRMRRVAPRSPGGGLEPHAPHSPMHLESLLRCLHRQMRRASGASSRART
eukprot:3069291-Prymnesium_polylepis.1